LNSEANDSFSAFALSSSSSLPASSSSSSSSSASSSSSTPTSILGPALVIAPPQAQVTTPVATATLAPKPTYSREHLQSLKKKELLDLCAVHHLRPGKLTKEGWVDKILLVTKPQYEKELDLLRSQITSSGFSTCDWQSNIHCMY